MSSPDYTKNELSKYHIMNPLEIRDTLNLIVESLANPQDLLVNKCILYLLGAHPDLVFIRSHCKSDIPKYGPLKFLSLYPHADAADAIKYGNLPVVRHLLSSATAVNINHIRCACENGHLDIVKYLVSLRIDSMNSDSWIVIYIGFIKVASSSGHLDIVKYLMSLRPDLTINGYTQDAVSHGHLNIVKYFISLRPDQIDIDKIIHIASEHGQLEIVKYAVSIGADWTSGNNYAIRWAATNGHLNVVKYLVSLGAITDNNAFKWACAKGHLEVVKYLMLLRTYDAVLTDTYNDALRHACEYGQLEIVKYLISIGADWRSNCIFQCAGGYGHLEIVKYLVSLNITLNRAIRNETIQWATANGFLEVVEYLNSI